MSYHSVQSRNLTFPYKAKSPTLKKHITYDEAELWREIDRVLAEDEEKKFSYGQQLYYNMLHCADSSFFVDDDTNFILEEYMMHKRFNIPLAKCIDDAPYIRMSLFSAIDEEYNACVENGKIHN